MKMRTYFFTLITMLAIALGMHGAAFAAKAKRHERKDDSCCSDLKKGIKCLKKHLKKRDHPACCTSVPIDQKTMNKVRGLLTLTKSGNYALAEDVTGAIVLEADSICLDLCCHTLSAGNRTSAIIANGRKALEVFNGQVNQARDAGILMANCASVEIYDLTMSNHLLDACRFTGCSALDLYDVKFLQNNTGERALFCTSCDNVSVSDCVATGFLSTIGAVVQFENSSGISMQDVDVTSCTKTLAAPSGGFPDALFNTTTRIFSMNQCVDFTLERVKVNKNTGNSAQDTNLFQAIGMSGSANGSLRQCETSNNTIINGGYPGAGILVLAGCNNILLSELLSNANASSGPINYFVGPTGLACTGIVLDGCQSNNTHISEFLVKPGFNASFLGMGTFFGADNVMRNCQSNNNRVDDTGEREVANQFVFVIGLNSDRNGLIENCEASSNSIGVDNPFTMVIGMNIESGNNVIKNSIFNDNIGGELATGMLLNTAAPGLFFNTDDVKIVNCESNTNGGFGLFVGNPFLTGGGTTNGLQILDSTLNNNGRANGDAAGVKLLTLDEEIENVLIKGCVITNTFASAGSAAGINIPNASNVIIEDAIVNNTTADGFGHGILLDTVFDSKILRAELHENQNSGVELVGANANVALIDCGAVNNDIGFDFASNSTASCCLVQDCKAIGNATAGFFHAPTPLTTTFIGNQAQCNGSIAADNYILGSGVINLQQLTWGTGSYSQITGAGAVLGSPLTNVRMVP